MVPENDSLLPLLNNLPNVIIHCRENNTIDKYQNSVKIWQSWCKIHSTKDFPAKPLTVALYLLYLIQSDSSFPTIEGAFYAIKFYHKFLGFEDVSEILIVRNMLEAAKRICNHKVKKKKPLKVEHLRKLYEKVVKNETNLTKLRTFNLCLLGFCGFLRYDELSNIRRYDIVFSDTFMKIFIEKSKTDIYREGAWVYISKGDTDICPVKNLRVYLQTAALLDDCDDCDDFIFRAVTVTKRKPIGYLRAKNKPLSYSRAREVVLEAIESIGLEKKLFGLHSLRSGGATAAANAGVSDRLFKRHGRWRSENAKDGYVEDDTDHLLIVTRNLGV